MNKLLQTLPLAAGLLAAASLPAQPFITDGFSGRTDGDILEGESVQFSSSGSPTYLVPTGTINTFLFDTRGSDGVIRPNDRSADPTQISSNAANSFLVPDMPGSGFVRFQATALPTEQDAVPGLNGMWIGLTNGDAANLQNNIGTAVEHITMRFLVAGPNTGRFQLQTYDGAAQSDTFSSSGGSPISLSFDETNSYQMTLDYNFDTGEVIGTLTDLDTSTSISDSITIASGLSLDRGQIDITGLDRDFLDAGSGNTVDDLPAFSDIAVTVPEPSAYALLGGILALGVAFLRRRRSQA